MIHRLGTDRYHVQTSGGEIDMELTRETLKARLVVTGFYDEESLARVLDLEVGDSTPPPMSFYLVDGVRYASVNGVMGKTILH